ncbi:serum paraoxonase/arylesterase 2-like [Pristis pectinata]|uniref:serum paraoxonase/arylesterase 2-like n=1 Tax=Pristis pectinata TaxID=685728 RepID=UPI00223DF12D|nr:serum paraoxonase/arylesterase 2-like [Pristis pectinata]
MGWLLPLVIFLALFTHRFFDLCNKLGVFKEVVPIEPGDCHLIKGIEYGSEDINILPGGLALISSGLKYPLLPNLAPPDHPGQIFLVDLNNPTLRAVELRISRGFEVESFNPHGLSTYIEKDGTVLVFVVNHPQHTSTVELFKFEEEQRSLTHLKTIRHELLNSVNDIIAVSSQSFYATNDHYYSSTYLRILEDCFGFQWGNVVYYSPTEVKQVATGYGFPNGIDISTDGKHIFLAETSFYTIHVMEINPNHSLTPKKSLDVGVLPDNVKVDPKTGHLWIGSCFNLWKALLYNPENPPGSEVIRVESILSKDPKVTHVYMNNGSVLQSTSVAMVYEDKLLIGTIFHKALYCELGSS